MVMVHARALEDEFVAQGYGRDRRDVMYNDFVILGPPEDPAGVKGMRVATDAFRKIAAAGAPFVTRGDKSGTHVKEMEVWKASGVEPSGAWYETFAEGSKGNKVTTRHADSRKAYVLMDRATYLTLKQEITLVPLVEGDKLLMNYIAVIAVNPERFPNVNAKGATAFMDWLTGDEAQALIRDFGKDTFGEPLFFPNAKH